MEDAARELLPKVKENKRIIFNGNGYSKEWEKEAGKRGLLNLKNTVDALPQFASKEAVALFDSYWSSTNAKCTRATRSWFETYNKVVNVEAQLTVLMANRYVLPAALEYAKQVGQSVAAVKAGGGKSVEGKKLLDKVVKLTDEFCEADGQARSVARPPAPSAEKHAKHFRDVVIPGMQALRATSDALEAVIPHELWPLATYREMLFIKVRRVGQVGLVRRVGPDADLMH